MSLDLFHPLVRDWFLETFEAPSEPQRRGWPEIAAGRDVLIAAPTGSGKTLAAFLSSIDVLVRKAAAGTLLERCEVVYVSPLKALSHDVHKNLLVPLAQIEALAARRGVPLQKVSVAVRTGDTTASERARMAKAPPHILVTTPESLYILLTSARGKKNLASVSTVIVDEVHAIADDKRGAHLALSLERLSHASMSHAGTAGRPLRVGLSATVKPIEEMARFVAGAGRPLPVIVDAGLRKDLDLAVVCPTDELAAVTSTEQWEAACDRLAALVREHRTTLVFVNTRRLVERTARRLSERLGEGTVMAHHGSLSRQTRLDAEQRLKRGELSCLVSTSSLELGIDIGSVDLVCQIGSPRALNALVQRVGRSGHFKGGTPKGRLFPLTRDELVECAAVVRAVRAAELDRLTVAEAPLDILAQQLVAAAADDDWSDDALFALARGAYPYRNLSREDFESILELHAEPIATRRGRSTALLHRDKINGRVRGRRGARLAAITSGGAIPETGDYRVVCEPEGTFIGTLNEDFAIESMAGDVFLLGNTSWRIRRVEMGTVRVEAAPGLSPTVPFWLAEAPGRTAELSEAVSALRAEVDDWLALRADEDDAGLKVDRGSPANVYPPALLTCGLDDEAKAQLTAYLRAGRAQLGVIPTTRTIVAERFFDETGGMQLVLHAPFGARMNRAWGLALRKRLCVTYDFELQAAATDDAVVLSLGPQHSFPLEAVKEFLTPASLAKVLTQAILQAPMFETRFRWNATRALCVLRHGGGKKVQPFLQRMRSNDLLSAIFPAATGCQDNAPPGDLIPPDHPLVKETLRDCHTEVMDTASLAQMLTRLRAGEIAFVTRDTPLPSVFSHEPLNARPYAFLDDAPLEERRARAVSVRRGLPPDVAAGVGALDLAAIETVREEAATAPRDEDEVHDVLLSLVLVPPAMATPWRGHLEALRAAGRMVFLESGAVAATERHAIARAALTGDEDAIAEVVRGHMEIAGPVVVGELAARLGLREGDVNVAMHKLESDGTVLRGRFTPETTDLEWCDRRLLARIHRLTLGRLRREIEPVSAQDLVRFLFRWQHVAPGTRLHGEAGTLAVITQLQGFELQASAWEPHVLAARVERYDPSFLDHLSLSGEIVWGRLARRSADAGLTRSAPITLCHRADLPWLLAPEPPASEDEVPLELGAAARAILAHLHARGASFSHELAVAADLRSGHVEDALWELVAAGFVTSDGFATLRSIFDRRARPHGREGRPAGRWALLSPPSAATSSSDEADARLAQQLLRRWGVVFRDLLARERLPSWRRVLHVLRRMELRGEVRGGRFVAGFVGEQFALPEALDAMRAVRKSPKLGEVVEVAAADPLNLIGIVTPGARVPAGSSQRVSYVDGVSLASNDGVAPPSAPDLPRASL